MHAKVFQKCTKCKRMTKGIIEQEYNEKFDSPMKRNDGSKMKNKKTKK